MPFKLRRLQVGDIEYFYIPKSKATDPLQLFPPEDFDNEALSILRTLPKNVIQLNDPYIFYGNVKSVQVQTPHRFSVVYPANLLSMIENYPYRNGIKVFMVDTKTDSLSRIVEKLLDTYSLSFFIFINQETESLAGFETYFFKNHIDFIAKLKARTADIEKLLIEIFPKAGIPFVVNLPTTEYHLQYNPPKYFVPSHTNYWTINQMIGNDWGEMRPPDNQEDIIEESPESARKPKDNLDRYDILIDQIKRIQELEIMTLDERKIQFPRGKLDYLSPILVVLPFNFPSLDQFLGVPPKERDKKYKTLVRSLSQEQAQNYIIYTLASNVEMDNIKIYGHLHSRKASYLDGVAYLHASFTYSPVIRLPTLGDSVKRELSFFKPETINDKKFRNSKTLINLFGKKLADRILPQSRESKIFGVPNQVVAITDLPIEWLLYKGINLCATHDITRIPEMPFGGILASFNVHSNFELSIPEDIIERVLVVLGVSERFGVDEEFKAYFDSIEALSQNLNFKTVRCSTLQQLKVSVEKHKPDILVFDCHGGYDVDSLSSYLLIGEERLSGKEIVENKLSAPIVFLSACYTNPNYGYVNKIADAFFEAGCMSVTATYFPISVKGGTYLYYRLIKQLHLAAKSPIHRNWLEFVCHIVRTSYLREVVYQCERVVAATKLPDHEKEKIIEKLNHLNLNASLEALRQTGREKVFKNLEMELKTILPKGLVNVSKVVSENCFYTHMGRGDLILFDSWKKKFEKLNRPTK